MKCDYCKKSIRSKSYIKIIKNPIVYLHADCWDAWDKENNAPIDITNKDKE